MNQSVLYNYFSEYFHTHVRLYEREDELVQTYSLRTDLPDTFVSLPEIAAVLFQPVSEPRLCSINNLLTYLTLPVNGCYCAIGPVGACADIVAQHQFPSLILPNEFIQKLYVTSCSELIRMGVFLYNLFADTPMEILTCYNHNCVITDFFTTSMGRVTKTLFVHGEYGKNHNPYEAEKREMSSIENGNLQQLHASWKEDYSGNLGMLTPNTLQSVKYLCIINIALSARAAIRGGLPFEMAYSLSDAYCQQIDAMDESSLPQIEGIIRNIQVTYTKLVAQQKGDAANNSAESPLVTRAKNYIFSHLHGKLTVNDVADALNTHPNYLNRIFRQTECITVHDYILREKTNLVRNMLTYSQYSYIEIANYLGFSSQSHLGNVFRKFTGMTLKQYRDTYKKV